MNANAGQFRYDLTQLYLRAFSHFGNKPLPAEYLAQLIRQISVYFEANFSGSINPDAYTLLLKTFLQSLVAFTKSYPFRMPDAEPLLWKPVQLLDTSEEVERRFHTALLELCHPFRQNGRAFEDAGISTADWAPYGYFEFSEPKPAQPIYGDTVEQRLWRQEVEAWREQQRRYERDRKETLSGMTPLQQITVHTPYYTFNDLLPQEPKEPFDIAEGTWFEGCWIVAAQGAGKTNLLRYLALQRLEQDATIIIIDSKGDLDFFLSFHRLKAIKDRLVVLKPTREHPLAINPFDTPHPTEFLEYLFTIFNSGLTAQQSLPFTAVFRLLALLPEPTLLKFSDIMVDGIEPYQEYVAQLGDRDQRFFLKEFNGPRWRERRLDIEARLKMLLDRNELLGAMLASRKTRLHMDELLESGRVICIDNSVKALGAGGAEFMGRLYLALICYAGLNRTGMKPVYVFLDEAHHFIRNDPNISDMITSLRSKRIGLVFAHQFVSQIEDPKTRGGLNTCALKFFNTTGENVSATMFFPGAGQTAYDNLGKGEFATFVKFKSGGNFNIIPIKEVKVVNTSPADPNYQTLTDQAHYPLMSNDEYQRMMLDMRKYFADPPSAPQPTPPPTPNAPKPAAAKKAGKAQQEAPQPSRTKSPPPSSDPVEDW